MTRDDVLAALNEIRDPCSCSAGVPAGLVDMGLVRDVGLTASQDGTRVRVKIGVTEPSCLMIAPFANEARKRLRALPGVAEVEVELAHELNWSPADMTPEYRERLRAHRAHRFGRAVTPSGRPLPMLPTDAPAGPADPHGA